MNQAMDRDDFQNWVNAKIESIAGEDPGNPHNRTSLRSGNIRHIKRASFEDRLTGDDKKMLTEMGISL
jgi:hypothetical protein